MKRELAFNDGSINLARSKHPLSTDSLLQSLSLGGRPWFHNGVWMFVLTPEGQFYVAPETERTKHSSLAKTVLAAGELEVRSGILVYLNNRSGHFRPHPDSLSYVVQKLFEKGVDVSRAQINAFPWSQTDRY